MFPNLFYGSVENICYLSRKGNFLPTHLLRWLFIAKLKWIRLKPFTGAKNKRRLLIPPLKIGSHITKGWKNMISGNQETQRLRIA